MPETIQFQGNAPRYGYILAFTVGTPSGPNFLNGPVNDSGNTLQTYSFQYLVSGNPPPLLTLDSGSLPPGLSLTTYGLLSGWPSTYGTYTGTVKASNGSGPAVFQSFSIKIGSSYNQWKQTAFTGDQANDPLYSDPSATPLKDGVTNLLKYVFHINPSKPISSSDRAALPTVRSTLVNSTPYVNLVHRQYNLLTGVTVSYETSNDLVNWTPTTPDSISIQGTDASTGDSILSVNFNATGQPKKFVRVRAVQP